MEQKEISPSSILQHLWTVQKEFNSNFIDFENLSEADKVNWSKEYLLHIMSEMDELLREMSWKIHRKQNFEIIHSNLVEEIIDIFKYWLSLAVLWNVSPEDFLGEFERKSEVVRQKYFQEKQMTFSEKKVVGVDIDGVLADYPVSFVNFVNKELGTTYNFKGISSLDLNVFFQLPEEEFLRLKDLYRQCGEKRNIPLIPGASALLKRIRQKEFTIVLLTSRPYKRYKRMFADTQEWLKKNELIYDAILWDEDKNERLIREFGAKNIAFFVEDNKMQAEKIARLGIRVYLLNKSYNQGLDLNHNIIRINELKEIEAIEK